MPMTIITAARNASLASLVPLLHLTSQVFAPAFALSSERASAAVAEHGAILDAIQKRNPDDAERVARAHIHATAVRLKAQLAGQQATIEA